ncbi:WD40-repeat-containing domain protein [Umbelopsis sp. PMI_123]|nr:WD40-repeat-containing domain protein [Umbelopsis sp. PMI_123]
MSNGDNVMEIPGYYYDPEKKKYFKFMPTGPYSRQNYKKSQQQQRQPVQGKRKVSCVTKLLRYCYLREIHARRSVMQSKVDGYQALLATLGQPQNILSLAATATSRPTALDVHPTKNHLMLGLSNGSTAQTMFTISKVHGFKQQALTLSPNSSDITCISMGSDDTCTVCTMGSGIDAPKVSFMKLDLPEHEDMPYLRPGAVIQSVSVPSWGSFWCCDQSKIDVARSVLGTDNQAIYFNHGKPSTSYFTNSAVLAAQIDPVQPHVFFGGCRDGRVKLFDARVDRRKIDARRGHSPYIIQHKSPITHLRKIGSSFHIVTAAMDGSLQVWDLRGHQTISSHTSYHQRQWPVLRFNGHKNQHTRSLGFDVLDDSNVVAVAGDDHIIRLWSLRGNSADPFHVLPMAAPIPALKFITNNSPGRTLGMLACTHEKGSPLQWLSLGASR